MSTRSFFLTLIRENPKRFTSGVGRTLMQYLGADALEKETVIGESMVFTDIAPKVSDGHATLTPKLRAIFERPAHSGILGRALWLLRLAYDWILIVANVFTALGLLAGLALRNNRVVVLCAIPICFMAPYALFLACLDRFAMPVYPLTIANLVVLPMLLGPEYLAWQRPRKELRSAE